MRDFWINIAAGVALSALSWFLFRILAPFYFAWRYRAVPLEGQWAFFDDDVPDAKAVGTASLKQSGERVTAVVTRSTSRKGHPISRSFHYSGRVRDGQLLMAFEEPVSNGFIAGNLVLKVSSDLKHLTGYTVYLDRDKGSVVAHPIWYRKS